MRALKQASTTRVTLLDHQHRFVHTCTMYAAFTLDGYQLCFVLHPQVGVFQNAFSFLCHCHCAFYVLALPFISLHLQRYSLIALAVLNPSRDKHQTEVLIQKS
jgi:hypothetical protein